MKTRTKLILGASTAIILIVLSIVFFVTRDSRCFKKAIIAYRSGSLAQALTIIDNLPPEYQRRHNVVYLKSDALLQIAQFYSENHR